MTAPSGNAVKVFYFGCIGDSGHYLFDGEDSPYGDRVPWKQYDTVTPFVGNDFDGQRFTPGRLVRDRWEGWPQTQSVYKLTHEAGWTMLGCWDRSVDTRPGSNSTFIIEGTHDFSAALEQARTAFPKTFARIIAAAPMREIATARPGDES